MQDKVTHIAATGGHHQLSYLASVNREHVQPLAADNVPETDGEVDTSRHQVALVVARVLAVRVEKTVHLTRVTLQDAMRQRVWRELITKCSTDLVTEKFMKKSEKAP